MNIIIGALIGGALGVLIGTYAPRLLPLYPKGTPVAFRLVSGEYAHGTYSHRAAFGTGMHRVRVTAGPRWYSYALGDLRYVKPKADDLHVLEVGLS